MRFIVIFYHPQTVACFFMLSCYGSWIRGEKNHFGSERETQVIGSSSIIHGEVYSQCIYLIQGKPVFQFVRDSSYCGQLSIVFYHIWVVLSCSILLARSHNRKQVLSTYYRKSRITPAHKGFFLAYLADMFFLSVPLSLSSLPLQTKEELVGKSGMTNYLSEKIICHFEYTFFQ